MARLFNLSLEETIAESEGIVTAKPQDEISAIENAEAAAVTEAEIEQNSDEVSEAMEEAEALGEQVAVNEEVLASTSGDEGISESQVVEAQESLKYALACFGSRAGYVDQVRVSTESARYMSRRQRLKVATEESKNFIEKLIEAAKKIIKQVYVKVAAWIKKMWVKLANYNKAIDQTYDKLKAIKPENIEASTVTDDFNNNKSFEIIGFSEGITGQISGLSKFNTVAGKLISTLKDKKPEDLRKHASEATSNLNASDENKAKQYFTWESDDDAMQVSPIMFSGRSMLAITNKGYKNFKLEPTEKDIPTVNVQQLYKLFVEQKAAVKKAVDNVGPIFKGLQKVQDASLKEVEDTEKEVKKEASSAKPATEDDAPAASGDSDTIKEAGLKVNTAKSVGVTAVMFFMNAYVNIIKSYIQVGKSLIDAKKS